MTERGTERSDLLLAEIKHERRFNALEFWAEELEAKILA